MAVYLSIEKSSESEASAVYRYSTTDERTGEFELEKASGETRIIQLAEGEVDQRLYQCAAYKVRKLFAEGSLPESTYWAS